MRRLAACLALALLVAAGEAQPPPGSSGSTAKERERELAEIRARIVSLQGRLVAVRRERTGLEGEVAALDVGLELQRARLAEAIAARNLAVKREAEIAAGVADLEQRLAETKLALEHRLAGLYRIGRQGYLRLILTLHPDARLLPSIRLLRFLARRDAQAVEGYSASREALAAERVRLEAERQERDAWVAREQTRRRDLVVLRNRRADLLARAEREGRSLTAEAGALAVKERKLANFVDLLYGRSQGPPLGAPIQQFRGLLDWPVRGQVAVGFGPRLDPRYRTQVPHNGLDLATAAGAEVRAIYPGKVLFAAPFTGYGWTVVLHHPGQVLSLSAGLSGLRVGAGDMVSLGQVVGLASDSLYFEIRVENRPEDPLSWLRSTRSP